jgi:spermidine/putrescine-binding protein
MSGKTNKNALAKRGLNRRTVLKGAAAAVGAAAVGLPAPAVHAARSIKIGVYGGYFKDSFDEFIFPEFAAASGIEVESVAEPTGETWLVQIRNAAKAGVAPADISMMGGFARLRGAAEELWLPLDESQMPNATKYLDESFVYRYPDGRLYGVGAVSWFITLCSNTDVYPEAPTSWADMWDPKYEDSLGLLALATNSYLLDITAATFFDADALTSQEGIETVLAKLAEVKPNVRLWYKDEGTFQPSRRKAVSWTPAAGWSARPRTSRKRRRLPEGRRCRGLRRLAGQQGLGQAGRGAGLHGLHVLPGDPNQALPQRRHRAGDGSESPGAYRRRVCIRLQQYHADRPAVSHLPGNG